jgi:hypothetical protein
MPFCARRRNPFRRPAGLASLALVAGVTGHRILLVRARGARPGRVEHLPGTSLDRMAEILGWPADGLDPYRLAAQTQVIRVVAMVAAKAGERPFDHEAAERFRQAMERSAARHEA